MSKLLMEYILSPSLLVYVVWHPDFDEGTIIAQQIQDHFDMDGFLGLTGQTGIEVTFQRADNLGSPVPLHVHWQAECPIIIVAMIDGSLVQDTEWVEYIHDLSKKASVQGLGTSLLPVAMEPGILDDLKLEQQFLRWDKWDSAGEVREQRFISELGYEFARMLRLYLYMLNHPGQEETGLEQHLEKIHIFLSHTKRDQDGEEIAKAMRSWLQDNSALSSFLDIYDIPAGTKLLDVIYHHIGKSIFLAIHTDNYSSSPWCRTEVIEAKRMGVPMIVVDCLRSGDERSFPYLGNVPVIRMDPAAKSLFPQIASRLIDEVLLDFLWRCRVAVLPERPADTFFMSRPPELLSVVATAGEHKMQGAVVYPDPPLSKEEMDLFTKTWDGLRVQTISQWLAENTI